MAGQRSYYSNILTTTRGAVRVTAQVQLNGASAPTVVAGRGVSAAHTGGANDCIVTFPEKFGKCTSLNAEYVPPAGHSAAYPAITANYAPATGKATWSIVFGSGVTVNSTTADNDPTGVLYIDAEFELGM